MTSSKRKSGSSPAERKHANRHAFLFAAVLARMLFQTVLQGLGMVHHVLDPFWGLLGFLARWVIAGRTFNNMYLRRTWAVQDVPELGHEVQTTFPVQIISFGNLQS